MKKVLIILISLSLLLFLGFKFSQKYIVDFAIEKIEKKLEIDIDLESFSTSLIEGSITLNNFSLNMREKDQFLKTIKIEKFYANISMTDLLLRKFVFEDLLIKNGKIVLQDKILQSLCFSGAAKSLPKEEIESKNTSSDTVPKKSIKFKLKNIKVQGLDILDGTNIFKIDQFSLTNFVFINGLYLNKSNLVANIKAGVQVKELGVLSVNTNFTFNEEVKEIYKHKLELSNFNLRMFTTLFPNVNYKPTGILSLLSELDTDSEEPNSIKNTISLDNARIRGANMEQIDSVLSQNKNLKLQVNLRDVFNDIGYGIGLNEFVYNSNKPSLLKSVYLDSLNCDFRFKEDKKIPNIENLVINEPQITLQKVPSNKGYGKESAMPALLVFVNKFNLIDGVLTIEERNYNSVKEIKLDRINMEFSGLNYPSSSPVDIKYSMFLAETNGEISGLANVIPELKPINFTIDTKMLNIPIVYFEQFYRNKIDVALSNGYISLTSKGQCKNDNLFLKQDVSLKNVKIDLENSAESIFLLNTKGVSDLIDRKNGTVDFAFNYSGNIRDAKNISQSIVSSVQSALTSILTKELVSLPTTIPEMINTFGDKEKRNDTVDQLKQLGKSLFGLGVDKE